MKRTALVRKTRLRPSIGTVWPKDVRAEIEARDGDCIGPRLGMPGRCWGGRELDHVRPGGMGVKSRSTADNGVVLCTYHHARKTSDGPTWRPVILDYLALFGYPDVAA